MAETLQVSGIVLSAMPIGETDKRVELLTRELGKISAFARGARRPGNALMAAANPFAFGSFRLIPGRNSYTLVEASIDHYFTELATRQPGIYYGFYYLDFAAYYSREGIDGTETLNLLYLSLKALLNENLPDELVRRVFELRLMAQNGEFRPPEEDSWSESARYAASYAATAPLAELYTFQVTPEVLGELSKMAERQMARVIDRRLKSREILEAMVSL